MDTFQITKIFTVKIAEGAWIAQTTFFSPAKTEVEVKENSEHDAYQKLKNLLGIILEPTMVEELENKNKIYQF